MGLDLQEVGERTVKNKLNTNNDRKFWAHFAMLLILYLRITTFTKTEKLEPNRQT